MKTAFLDSSVLFTAVNSPIGGSAKLFTIPGVQLIASKIILIEVERNVREKLQSYHLERFFMLVGKLKILDQTVDDNLINRAKKIIAIKDAVILAEAKNSHCEFLITLDRKHFLTVKVAKFLEPSKILTPKEFFEII